MEKAIANEIAALEPDYKLRDDYSGRGMYGRETYAIIVPSRDDVGFLKKKYKNEDLVWDNMGLNYVIY